MLWISGLEGNCSNPTFRRPVTLCIGGRRRCRQLPSAINETDAGHLLVHRKVSGAGDPASTRHPAPPVWRCPGLWGCGGATQRLSDSTTSSVSVADAQSRISAECTPKPPVSPPRHHPAIFVHYNHTSLCGGKGLQARCALVPPPSCPLPNIAMSPTDDPHLNRLLLYRFLQPKSDSTTSK